MGEKENLGDRAFCLEVSCLSAAGTRLLVAWLSSILLYQSLLVCSLRAVSNFFEKRCCLPARSRANYTQTCLHTRTPALQYGLRIYARFSASHFVLCFGISDQIALVLLTKKQLHPGVAHEWRLNGFGCVWRKRRNIFSSGQMM
jgi:hypothetical protein